MYRIEVLNGILLNEISYYMKRNVDGFDILKSFYQTKEEAVNAMHVFLEDIVDKYKPSFHIKIFKDELFPYSQVLNSAIFMVVESGKDEFDNWYSIQISSYDKKIDKITEEKRNFIKKYER